MKKRTRLLLVLVAALCLCLGFGVFAACKNEPKKHVHEYTAWAYNSTHHWRECPVDEAADESTREEHTMVDGKCTVCDYEEAVEHVHAYTQLQADAANHWYECPVDNDYIERFGHIYGNDGKCIVCEKEGTAPDGTLDTRKWYVAGSGAGDLNGVGWDVLSKLKPIEALTKLDSNGNTVYSIQLKLYSGDEFKLVQDLDWDDGLGYFGFGNLALGSKDFKDAGSGNITPLAGHDGVYEFYIRTKPDGGATANMVEYRLVEHLDPLDISTQYEMYIIGQIADLGSNWEESPNKMRKMELQADGATFRGEIKLTPSDAFKVYNLKTDNYYPTGTGNDLKVQSEGMFSITWKIGDAVPKVEVWKHEHNYSAYAHDDTNHWGVCPDDGVENKDLTAQHEFGGDAYCDVCGYEKTDKPECATHTWTVDNVCSVCGRHWLYTEDLSYKISADKTSYSVTGYDGDTLPAGLTHLVIPYGFNGKPVVEIGDNAFYDKNKTKFAKITQVTLPDSVTKIGSWSFRDMAGLKEVDLGNGVVSIADYAFAFSNLSTITLPDTVTALAKGAFYSAKNLYKVQFSKNLTTIGESAFELTRLVELSIPASVVTIDPYAFRDCTSLQSVEFEAGSNLKTLNTGAFFGDLLLTSVELPEGLEKIGGSVFSGRLVGIEKTPQYPALVTLRIPASVKSVGGALFGKYKGTMTALEFADPNGWVYTSGSEKIVLTADLLSDSKAAYEEFFKLGEPTLTKQDVHEHVYKVRATEKQHWLRCTVCGALEAPAGAHTYDLDGYCTVCEYLHTHTFADTWTSDANGHWHKATCGCDLKKDYAAHSLSTSTYKCSKCNYQHTHTWGTEKYSDESGHWYMATCHTSVASEHYAHSFVDDVCSVCKYERVQQGENNGTPNLKFLVNDAYTGAIVPGFSKLPEDLSQLTEIVIPAKVGKWDVVEVAADAFYDKNKKNFVNVTKVVIPDTVTRIGANAFRGLSALDNLTLPSGEMRILGNYAFAECVKLTSFTLKAKVLGTNLFYGCTGLTTVTLPAGITEIPASTFSGCTALTTVNNMDKLTSIGGSAFSGCTALTTIALPATLTSIGSSAFSGAGLTTITLPAALTSLGSSAFQKCTQLTAVKIPDLVPSIGSSLFSGCTNLATVDLGKTTSVGSSAFNNCTSLQEIAFPDTMTSIGTSAFSGCSGLTKIDFKNMAGSVSTMAFRNCTSLETIIYSPKVTISSTSVFSGSTHVKNVTFAAGTTAIGNYWCYGFAELTSVTIPSTVMTIGSSAFYGCKTLGNVTLPANLTAINASAFKNCAAFTEVTIPDKVTSIGSGAFSGCTNLATLKLGAALTKIEGTAFENCTSLTSIQIPASVDTISVTAFKGCTGLTSVTFAQTANWVVATSATATTGTAVSVDLKDVAKAAELLVSNSENTANYFRRVVPAT